MSHSSLTTSPDSVRGVWDAIEAWLAAHAPEVLEQLRPAAREASLQDLERLVKRALPYDLRESLLIHDGTSPELGLLGGRELLCVAQAREVWNASCNHTRAPFRKFVPIAADPDHGEHHFVASHPNGTIVTSWHYGDDHKLVAPSFLAWLQALLADLENGMVSVVGSHLRFKRAGLFKYPAPRGLPFIPGTA